MNGPVRIAMWSGPRNISTAMMRSFENRADCAVSDEPFYGCYLKRTGIDHPMAAQVIAAMDCDFDSVAGTLQGTAPGGAPIWYQKHMSHHMLPDDDLSWSDGMAHCFLIRQPEAMVASYAKKRETPVPADFGFDRQCELFELVADRTGTPPPVLDAADVLRDPRGALTALCAAVGIAFDEAMLSWPPGRRDSDGVWADVWYANVEASTGFLPYDPSPVDLSPALRDVANACRPAYERMAAHRLVKR
ncbi:MAG: HAD family hydrolase [Alphaproteobacteria bacterium]|nr:HAD family hydrolase [Alphaproteobacteria bacterium]